MELFLAAKLGITCGITLCPARRLNEDERKDCSPSAQDRLMVAAGEGITLFHITTDEFYKFLGNPKAAGAFCGYGNIAYMITQEQWDGLVALDKRNAEAEAAKNRAEELEALEHAKARAEAQMKDGKLPAKEEADRITYIYNERNNDGGWGYVPYFYDAEEYQNICARLAALKGEA